MNQKAFQAQLKNLFREPLSVDAQSFWKQMQQSPSSTWPSPASEYCEKLFEYLSQPLKERKQYFYQNQQRMYATLLPLEYYKNRKQKPQALITACRKYEEEEESAKGRRRVEEEELKWILRVFRATNKEDGFVQGFICLIAGVPLEVDWQKFVVGQVAEAERGRTIAREYRRQKIMDKEGVTRFLYPMQSLPCLSSSISMAYICFLDSIRSNQNSLPPRTYTHLTLTLQCLLNTCKASLSSHKNLCIFLHFLINCVTYYSCTKTDVLRDLMGVVACARICWGSVGELADQLFAILAKEIKMPGWGFRKKIRFDFPAIDVKELSFLSRECYLVTAAEDPFSCPQDRSLISLRKQMIVHLLKISGIEPSIMHPFLEILKNMGHDLTFNLYYKALKIADLIIQLQVFDKIQPLMRERMLDLIADIRERFERDKNRAEQMEVQEFTVLREQGNELQIFCYPMVEIKWVGLRDFLDLKSKNSFYEIIRKIRSQQPKLLFYQGTLDIIFYGTCAQFNNIVGIITRFLQQSDIEQCQNLQIFYLPKPEQLPPNTPTIPGYLCSQDPWYHTFIYSPFKQKTLFPYLQPTSNNKNLFPSYLMNRTLQMYLREARRRLHLPVWRCRIKLRDRDATGGGTGGNTGGEWETRYFVGEVGVGLVGEADSIRANKMKVKEKRVKYSGLGSLDIVREKFKKPFNFVCDLGFQYMQPMTGTIHHKQQQSYQFQNLQVCSLPWRSPFSPCESLPSPPSTSSPACLQMWVLSSPCAQTFLQQLQNPETFRENKSQSQIQLAFGDLFMYYRVRSLSLRNRSEKSLLKIVVDGELFHRVQALEIDAPVSNNGVPIMLPIMGFLPCL